MKDKYIVVILSQVSEYLAKLSAEEEAAALARIRIMAAGDMNLVHTKQLDGPIRELIVGDQRITYISEGAMLYFVEGFRKKTQKTPKSKIDFAKKVHKTIKSQK